MSDELDVKIHTALNDFFGFNTFKGTQLPIIRSILEGHDTFVIMPTGGGKSLCYQLPALICEGTAIIISPLIALMKNQVDLIKGFGGKSGIAHFLNSSLSKKESDQVKLDVISGITKMLFVAPESLTKDETVSFLAQVKIPFVAVDEAHCISEWGHDFRPEYRRIREIVENIGKVPIIALTASATPKVQDDIVKNLRMNEPNLFASSFDRPNLYYEIRPKTDKNKVLKDIIGYCRKRQGQSGIIYCLSRKTVEEIAETLRINGVNAMEYHAGMDAHTRSRNQDKFLMEDVDVIVATIAFGMGIDKPDVRYVIHYDVPKSLESYYQETGRAGRDGIYSECILFYASKDLHKLEKFLKGKPVAEQEIGLQLLQEISGFCENGNCRRRSLLHYFGEENDEAKCAEDKMCDNHKFPKEKIEASKYVKILLTTMQQLADKFPTHHVINVLQGEETQGINNHGHNRLPNFGVSKDKDVTFWKSIIRGVNILGLIEKDIESYGSIFITEEGNKYLESPIPVQIAIDQNFDDLNSDDDEPQGGKGGFDEELFILLKELRKKVSKENNLPPYIIFQDPSLEEMALKYPLEMKEMSQIIGVSMTKAERYGKPFLELIAKYVTENEIERADDLVVKSVVNKSALKVYIIQNIDRKMSLEVIANSKGVEMGDLLNEIENIVKSGSRVNLNYYLNELLEEDVQEEIYDYFLSSESDSTEAALNELGPDVYTFEEVQLMKIKFISEMAN